MNTSQLKEADPAPQVGRLREPWLTTARVIWILLTGLSFAVTLPGLAGYYSSLTTSSLPDFLGAEWTPALVNNALIALHLTPALLTGYVVSLDLLRVLIFLSIGGLIFWRKSDQWLGLFASYVMIYIGLTVGGRSFWFDALPLIWRQILGIPHLLGQ